MLTAASPRSAFQRTCTRLSLLTCPTRLAILAMLADRPGGAMNAEIRAAVAPEIHQSALSQILRLLLVGGLVARDQVGRAARFRLTPSGREAFDGVTPLLAVA